MPEQVPDEWDFSLITRVGNLVVKRIGASYWKKRKKFKWRSPNYQEETELGYEEDKLNSDSMRIARMLFYEDPYTRETASAIIDGNSRFFMIYKNRELIGSVGIGLWNGIISSFYIKPAYFNDNAKIILTYFESSFTKFHKKRKPQEVPKGLIAYALPDNKLLIDLFTSLNYVSSNTTHKGFEGLKFEKEIFKVNKENFNEIRNNVCVRVPIETPLEPNTTIP
jgi:hypothetical protein